MNGSPESLMLEGVQNANLITLIENGSAKVIPLTKGKAALVDAEDYEWLAKWKWHAQKSRHTYYAARGVWYGERHVQIRMHRVILGLILDDGIIVDHKNRNGLDNRRDNLRIARFGLNAKNCGMRIDNASGYRGVYWCNKSKKWRSQINIKGKRTSLGYYQDPVSAALAYDCAVKNHWGEGVPLNFSEGGRDVK